MNKGNGEMAFFTTKIKSDLVFFIVMSVLLKISEKHLENEKN